MPNDNLEEPKSLLYPDPLTNGPLEQVTLLLGVAENIRDTAIFIDEAKDLICNTANWHSSTWINKACIWQDKYRVLILGEKPDDSPQ